MQEVLLFIENNMYLILCVFAANIILLAWMISIQNKRYAMLEKKLDHNTIVLAEMLINQSNYVENLKDTVDKALATLKNVDSNPFDNGLYGYFEWGERETRDSEINISPSEPTKDIRLHLVSDDDEDAED
tara:strand:- start:667 stop:1056 length:390 start_codon:yes stop_codon:yes gene_type:complete